MLRGIYSSATAMLTQKNKLDVIANNIANSTTTGYKSDMLISQSFEDMLISRVNDSKITSQVKEVGPFNTGIHVDSVVTDFKCGSMVSTGKTTDVGITTDGFFTVETPQGIRYTRDGAFTLTNEGVLVNQDGFPVMGESGEITLTSDEFSIKQNGEITQDGETIDKLLITDFDDYTLLRKESGNLYQNTGANEMEPEKLDIRQGFLESSNVSIVDNLVDMMTVYRNYETNQKMIQTMDSTLGKAVELGRI